MYARTIEVTDRVDNCYTVTRIVCIFMQSVIRIIRLNLSISEAMIKQKKKKKKKREGRREGERKERMTRKYARTFFLDRANILFFSDIRTRYLYSSRSFKTNVNMLAINYSLVVYRFYR